MKSKPKTKTKTPVPKEAGDWRIFRGKGAPHNGLRDLPDAPRWRFSWTAEELQAPEEPDTESEATRAISFQPTEAMIIAVNAALYLRRPLLITGKPGAGKSTLISKVAHELNLGRVIRWPINSRSTVRQGIYDYDAVGRLQAGGNGVMPPVEQYLSLGSLGTALMAKHWPHALLIDEIDKSDLDFANDLLNVIEEGEYLIPELARLENGKPVEVRDALGEPVEITDGKVQATQFPFVVMTSNGEREFPAPFLRRCIRLHVEPPVGKELTKIVNAHLKRYAPALDQAEVTKLIEEFEKRRKENQEVATDQLLNAVFLAVAMPQIEQRTFTDGERAKLVENLLSQLNSVAG